MVNPPKFFLNLFRWFCHPRLVKPIEGDLLELYDERVKELGKRKADLKFVKDVLLLMRRDIIRPADGTYQLTNYGMIKHNIKLAFRSFKRFKTSFLINLIGLSSGLASVFLIYNWIESELKVDKFHANDDRLYQVMQNINNPDGIITIEYTQALLGQALVEEMPEVEMSASMVPVGSYGSDRIIEYQNKKLKIADVYASEDFFKVFSYDLLRGNASNVLSSKDGLLISEDYSNILFGENFDPVGETVTIHNDGEKGSFIVTGVFKNLPDHSTHQFDVVYSLELFLHKYPHIRKWGNSDPATYLVLKEDANVEQLSQKVKGFVATKLEGYRNTHFLQKYSDRYLNGTYINGMPIGGRIQYVKLFSIIAVLVLIIACINFMNLSTARASRRLKEIGVKKAMGAKRRSLMTQYFTEAFLMTGMAIIMAGIAVVLVLPFFNALTGKELSLTLNRDIARMILLIGGATAILSGSYPAVYLSGFDPINIFRGKIKGSIGDLWARKGLVIFQFSISIFLIASVMVITSQIDFIQNKNLGFKKDHILYFNTDGEIYDNSESFMTELRSNTDVIHAGMFGHDLLGDAGATSGVRWEGKAEDTYQRFYNLEVGYDLLETFGMELVEGRTYSKEYGNEETKILFNESAIKAMGLENPVGSIINLWGRDREIIGVVKDFHFKSLHEEIKPCFIQFYEPLSTVVVRIKAGNELETIERIEDIYQSHNPGLTFDFKFFDQEYDALYHSEQQVAKLSQSFGAVAILVSCLGLFGLVAFTSERRQKEIGIRKVLGSSEIKLVLLLTSDFSKMVAISILIALPVSYYIMKIWLDAFAYRISLDVSFFIGAGIFSMIIAWITMSLQTFKAAKANPVESLKNE